MDKDIDTSTPIGKFFLTIIGAVAELERENILQRVKAVSYTHLDVYKRQGLKKELRLLKVRENIRGEKKAA